MWKATHKECQAAAAGPTSEITKIEKAQGFIKKHQEFCSTYGFTGARGDPCDQQAREPSCSLRPAEGGVQSTECSIE